MEKPPLGAMPKKIWLEKRIAELQRALDDYIEYLRRTPDSVPEIFDLMNEWIKELQERVTERISLM